MKKIAVCCGVFLLAIKLALGQPSPPIATRTINLTAEQYHVIKENVLKGAAVESKTELPLVKIGDRVSSEVNLKPFPSDLSEKISSLKSHTYYIDKRKIVIVDPKDNTVADIIE